MTGQQALSHIPAFSSARIGAVLSDGPSNTSLLVHRGDARFVLRLDKPGTRSLGLDRSAEQAVCETVSAAGLAPQPVFFDHDNGIYLRHFTAGEIWKETTLQSPNALERLARLFRAVHDLPPAGAEFDPGSAVANYAAQLGTAHAERLQQKAENLLLQVRARQERSCLCHNDPVCGNILEADRLMLIDWEYAGIGDPWFDLAVVVQHHGLGKELGEVFLRAYLQREPGAEELARLWLACDYYQCLLELWHLRIGEQ